eukprot:3660111-Amphidinium_carterae.1
MARALYESRRSPRWNGGPRRGLFARGGSGASDHMRRALRSGLPGLLQVLRARGPSAAGASCGGSGLPSGGAQARPGYVPWTETYLGQRGPFGAMDLLHAFLQHKLYASKLRVSVRKYVDDMVLTASGRGCAFTLREAFRAVKQVLEAA